MSLKLNLQLFAEGGDGAAAEGAEGAGALGEAFERLTGEKWEVAAPAPKEAEAPKAAAETGKPGAQGESPAPQAAESADPDKEFELIREKYKAQIGKLVQHAVNDRFKNQRKAEKENEELWDAIGPNLQKYGVKRGDVAGLRAAAEKDKSNFNKIAFEKGISVEEAQEEYATIRETEKQNREKEQQAAEQKRQQDEAARQQVYAAWQKDEAEIRKTDPEFSLMDALKSEPEFLSMVNAGVSVKNAYRAVYYERNMANVAGAVYRQGRADTAQSIASRANRPAESALGTGAPGSVPGGMGDMKGEAFDAFLRQKGLLS